jgi:3-hydroxyacyl-CoA dehydrogenase
MTEINEAVDYRVDGDIALVTLRNPPVNALRHAVRAGVLDALGRVRADAALRAVVLAGSERAFSAGADITEFGKPRTAPSLIDLIAAIEAMEKPVVAAIHGLALGGGLELALGCHYRVAWKGARLGLPEIKLGLIPGAGGTQLLPRLIGVAKALPMILSGEPVAAEAAPDGLLDAVLDGAYPDAAIAWARAHATALPLARTREDRVAGFDAAELETLAAPVLRRARGAKAPEAAVRAIRHGLEHGAEAGSKHELQTFLDLLASDESKAQRHVFFAEREAQKVPDMPAGVAPRAVKRAAVIGAGTMGGGIAMCFANAGIPVTVVEAEQAALDRGLDRVRGNYETAVKRGSLAAGEPAKRMALITPSTDFADLAEADIVIEAVFEEMALKLEIFAELDRVAKPGAVLATNTSTLDVNEIARATKRPQDVLGMHFFSPANVMKLLEIVRGRETAFDALATALAVGRKIGKVTAVVGVCDGFVGNRMLHRRSAQAEKLLLEGALPQEVDAAVTGFGFPMGPFAMSDLAGLDVGWRIRKGRGTRAAVSDALCEAGRFGQKTNAGYFRYEPGARTPLPDPEVERIIVEASAKEGVARRAIPQEEIRDRMLLPMINEAARILEEGIASRPGDVDVIWIYGYGWPAHRGGPMFHADQLGLGQVRDRLNALAEQTGDDSLRPAALLNRLADEGKGFASLTA